MGGGREEAKAEMGQAESSPGYLMRIHPGPGEQKSSVSSTH